ncbi:PepSY-associated TM helix domain-containing protein [Methylosinus sp. LW4]|uniref:PepSY-associated TM helix domain-containing protein n=1 Tax=Methylosinus sp. LW4 TaxID=136993 RepID=UPI00037E608C|nr:PepSY-associated TM helix domain-containing protein [Methylosinus sp. LW4]
MIRNIFVVLHRWIGLAMAVFLVIVGLTGSLLAFHQELDHVFARQFYVTPRPGVPPLDLATLMERAPLISHARIVGAQWNGVDQAQINYLPEKDPATDRPYDLGFTQFYVDPWTGAELGRRTIGDYSKSSNVMRFIYKLHVALLVSGPGTLILGIVAVLWTLDCFNGFYLTLPVSLSAFWRKWKTAWVVKRGAGFYRLNLDLHRASGLWLWPMLLVFAWSSVMFNLRPVYDWTMSKFMAHSSLLEEAMKLKDLPQPAAKPVPVIGARAAFEAARRLAAEQARAGGFEAPEPSMFAYMDKMGVYVYGARGAAPQEGFLEGRPTLVTIDGDTGAPADVPFLRLTEKQDIVDRWLVALHVAGVFGLPYKIFVCILGLVVAMLSATGVYIWWKKRRARRFRKKQGVSVPPLEATPAE